ncbi:autotransporter assembly complex protein TamA [Flavobacterium sp. MXW15]|uniref:Translocation and assembly module subunit TamA n=1 Tax=Xanthomonas chitinilytica TaxID=2989819 RepID=A0ABT3JXJ7_9XANT|nr:autotransporter assembly complex family protein [Xanthomonas sp. H13-6]MCW4455846.1 autotransporter assembly complex protein TamA [Flavobacterium sp. MXW15]MCW4473223.1 autotransporter assembly complex protein TamA [Xanthomonas sp. H13-6]
MQPRFLASLALFLCLAAVATAHARGTIEKVEITGLDKDDDAAMIENIEVSLTLYESLGKVQGESRLEYLLAQAERQTAQALEPFGYYNPTITVEAPREGDRLQVRIHVDKGEPVRVRRADIAITGPGEDDRYLQQDLRDFQPRKGEVFDHTAYESSKVVITRRLAERGYFDADFTQRQVAVTRAENAADIDLSWDSGGRYDMGPTRFHQDYFNQDLFDPLVYWEEGSYYHEGKLDRLRESLTKLDYFSTIDIQPRPEEADDDWRVPVDVNLALAKRNIYSAGLSYGSESGAGVRAGVDRRYVNRRGHKLSTQLDYAQKRKSLTTSYRVPAFHWLDGWYTLTAAAYDEQTDYIDLRNVRLIGSRSGEINEHWTAIASINALRERWRYSSADSFEGSRYEYSTLLYPQLVADYVAVDDEFFPRRGFSGNATLRGGVEGAGSDTSFVQVHATLRWYLPIGDSNRLVLRGEGGTTWTSDLVAMPPSLRYFAGGDRSIRGYAFREVGPRTPAPDKFALGAKNVVTASAEYEHYFGGGPWGAAVFVDTGSAFDNDIDLHTGVGFGVRWKSPVGPVRVDIAHGLNHPDSQFQLYLNIGADL